MRTEDRPSVVEPLKALPLTLASLVVVVGAVDLLLLLQPGILLALRGDWQRAVPSGSSTSTLLAATVILASIAISATILTAFVRGVRAAPYLCLAPLWVGLCMLVIGRMPVVLPLPMPTPAFVAICALLFVGSGVLFERRASSSNLAGATLSLLPIVVLSIGYALTPARFDASAILLLFVLSVAAAGAPVIAIACRPSALAQGGSQHELGEQIDELLERVRTSEARAERAEHQLSMQPAAMPSMAAAGTAPRIAFEDEAALLSPRGGSSWTGWAAAGVLFVLSAGGYFVAVSPLREELAKQQHENATLAERHGEELAVVRAQAERDRKMLEERATAAAPEPPPTPPTLTGPSAKAAAALLADKGGKPAKAAADDEGEPPDTSILEAERAAQQEERRAARQARREEAAAERESRAAERAAAREQRAAERASARDARAEAASSRRAESDEEADDAEDEAPPEPKRAAPAAAPRDSMESQNDDPLEGLDGL